MKRLLSLIIVLAMTVSLVACGSADNQAAEVRDEVVSEKEPEEAVAEEVVEAAEPEEKKDETERPVVGKNMLSNGNFDYELAYWNLFESKGGMCTFAAPGKEGKVKITNAGKVNYSVQPYYDGFALVQGGVYRFEFDMNSTVPRSVEARIQINGSDYHAYVKDVVDLTEEMQHYSIDFTMVDGSDPAPRLCFNLGQPDDMEEPLPEHLILIDNVAVTLIDDSNIHDVEIVDNTTDINLNQVGYLTEARKTATSRTSKAGDSFEIISVDNGNSVYTGEFKEVVKSKQAREEVAFADFTDFVTPGTYKIVASNGGESYPFAIGDDVYDDLLIKSFLFLYTQRCGMEITKDLAGEFAHPACHTTEAVVYGTNEVKTVIGGWHDAGDYGRYVVPGAVTVADLFLSYEDNADIWDSVAGDNVGIPESGNGIPDILDEAKYELDWMLMMQDEATGGVYHKISCLEFPGFVMPEEETEQLVLAPISHTATGDFAAIMAKASMVYADIDKKFADNCLEAAKKAWKYLEANPDSEGYHNPDDILTGEYPDMRDPDERLWAAVSLYHATGDQKYNDFLTEVYNKYVSRGYGWAQISTYANLEYLSLDENMINQEIADKIKNDMVETAEEILELVNTDGYHSSLGDSYSWGSNMNVANNARMLIDAYRQTGKEDYATAAYDQMSYILGQNTTSYCFLSGFGTVSPVHAHHRPSMATGYVLPGMVIGGPDQNKEDPLTKATMGDVAPAACYIDSDQSFSTNEVTIYWNSPFVYLLSYEMMNANK